MAFSTLLAPGVPVSLSLGTPGGALDLKASSYAINLRAGRVLLEKPEVYGPDGRLIFSCRRIDVAGLNVVAIQKSELKVRVIDAYALLGRSKTGQFAVTSYFPQTGPSQGGGIVFQADVTRVNGEFLDNYGSSPFTQKFEVFDIKAAGLGGDCSEVGSSEPISVLEALLFESWLVAGWKSPSILPVWSFHV